MKNIFKTSLQHFHTSVSNVAPMIARTRVSSAPSEAGLRVTQLFISNVTRADNGSYYCLARTRHGAARSQFVLHVTSVKEGFTVYIKAL